MRKVMSFLIGGLLLAFSGVAGQNAVVGTDAVLAGTEQAGSLIKKQIESVPNETIFALRGQLDGENPQIDLPIDENQNTPVDLGLYLIKKAISEEAQKRAYNGSNYASYIRQKAMASVAVTHYRHQRCETCKKDSDQARLATCPYWYCMVKDYSKLHWADPQ